MAENGPELAQTLANATASERVRFLLRSGLAIPIGIAIFALVVCAYIVSIVTEPDWFQDYTTVNVVQSGYNLLDLTRSVSDRLNDARNALNSLPPGQAPSVEILSRVSHDIARALVLNSYINSEGQNFISSKPGSPGIYCPPTAPNQLRLRDNDIINERPDQIIPPAAKPDIHGRAGAIPGLAAIISRAYAQQNLANEGSTGSGFSLRLAIAVTAFVICVGLLFTSIYALLHSTNEKVIDFAIDTIKSLAAFFLGVATSYFGIAAK